MATSERVFRELAAEHGINIDNPQAYAKFFNQDIRAMPQADQVKLCEALFSRQHEGEMDGGHPQQRASAATDHEPVDLARLGSAVDHRLEPTAEADDPEEAPASRPRRHRPVENDEYDFDVDGIEADEQAAAAAAAAAVIAQMRAAKRRAAEKSGKRKRRGMPFPFQGMPMPAMTEKEKKQHDEDPQTRRRVIETYSAIAKRFAIADAGGGDVDAEIRGVRALGETLREQTRILIGRVAADPKRAAALALVLDLPGQVDDFLLWLGDTLDRLEAAATAVETLEGLDSTELYDAAGGDGPMALPGPPVEGTLLPPEPITIDQPVAPSPSTFGAFGGFPAFGAGPPPPPATLDNPPSTYASVPTPAPVPAPPPPAQPFRMAAPVAASLPGETAAPASGGLFGALGGLFGALGGGSQDSGGLPPARAERPLPQPKPTAPLPGETPVPTGFSLMPPKR